MEELEELIKKSMRGTKILFETCDKGIKIEIAGNKASIMFGIREIIKRLKKDNRLDEDDIQAIFSDLNEKKEDTNKDDESLDLEMKDLAKKLTDMFFGLSKD